MKTIITLLLLISSTSALTSDQQHTGVMLDYEGLTIKYGFKDPTVDSSRWDLNIQGKYSVFTRKGDKNSKIFVARNEKGNIVGVKESYPTYQRYLVKDFIGLTEGRIFKDGFSISTNECKKIEENFDSLEKCRSILESPGVVGKGIGSDEKAIFPEIPVVDTVGFHASIKAFEGLSEVLSNCKLLKRYTPKEVNFLTPLSVPRKTIPK